MPPLYPVDVGDAVTTLRGGGARNVSVYMTASPPDRRLDVDPSTPGKSLAGLRETLSHNPQISHAQTPNPQR